MRPLYSFSRFRLSSLALALALLFALAGLYAVDHVLSASNQTQVRVEAAESAALVQGFLAVHAEALQSIRGLYLDTTRTVSHESFQSLVTSMTEYAASFQHVWVSDTAGRITEQYVFDPTIPALPPALDIDTTHALTLNRIAQEVRRSRHMVISVPGPLLGAQRGIVMLEPMYLGARFLGFAGGTITSDAILQLLEKAHPTVPGRLIVLAGTDTIAAGASRAPLGPLVNRASSTLRTPGGETWQIDVVQASTSETIRLLLWGIGLAALGALIVLLVHERRQGDRLMERSAELERLSAELLRANRAKSEFLANVSHELRTPLNAIVGFVELLRDGVYGELAPRQIPPVDRIASSATHLRQLVDQVLDLAKMAAGRLEVHLETVDLRPFVLNTASEVESLVNERGLNFSIAVSTSLPRIRTDPMHLRQILMNLLGNAIKFTPSGGIAIRARLVPNGPDSVHTHRSPEAATIGMSPSPSPGIPRAWIALQVADSGIGIAPADRERIFEEFEQVTAGPRSDSAHRGTGLGLSISRRLARLLGGDLTLESELGKGSTFTVWLPVESGDAAGSPPATAASASSSSGIPLPM